MLQNGCNLFILNFLLISLAPFQAGALSFSNTLKFQTTTSRVTAKDFQDYFSPVYVPEKVNTFAPEQLAESPKPKAQLAARIPSVNAVDISQPRGNIPNRSPHQARIFVVDEEALLNGKIKPIPNAYISFISPELKENFYTVASKNGLAVVPYPFSESLRFFARSNGYMMGMGYATFGNITIVPLLSKERFSSIAKSLNLRVPDGQIAVFGKLLNSNLKGISHSQINFRSAQPQMFYSGSFFGGIPGYFIESNQTTDQAGAFIANGLSRSLHSIQILNSEHTIPGYKLDLSGIPESVRFVSLALQSGPALNISTEVLDAETYERPECGLQTLISNHTKPAIPNEDGSAWIESKDRPTVNDLKVNTDKCEGYLATYLSAPSNDTLFPPTIGLFSETRIKESLAPLHRSWSSNESIVIGRVYPQKNYKHPPMNEVAVSVVSSTGEIVQNAEILYFNSNYELDAKKKMTDAHVQNFIVLGLEQGEYHFVYRDGESASLLGIEVVRVKMGGVTQVDF